LWLSTLEWFTVLRFGCYFHTNFFNTPMTRNDLGLKFYFMLILSHELMIIFHMMLRISRVDYFCVAKSPSNSLDIGVVGRNFQRLKRLNPSPKIIQSEPKRNKSQNALRFTFVSYLWWTWFVGTQGCLFLDTFNSWVYFSFYKFAQLYKKEEVL